MNNKKNIQFKDKREKIKFILVHLNKICQLKKCGNNKIKNVFIQIKNFLL